MGSVIADQIIKRATHLGDEIGMELGFGISGSHARMINNLQSKIPTYPIERSRH